MNESTGFFQSCCILLMLASVTAGCRSGRSCVISERNSGTAPILEPPAEADLGPLSEPVLDDRLARAESMVGGHLFQSLQEFPVDGRNAIRVERGRMDNEAICEARWYYRVSLLGACGRHIATWRADPKDSFVLSDNVLVYSDLSTGRHVKEAVLVGLDSRTGRELWRAAMPGMYDPSSQDSRPYAEVRLSTTARADVIYVQTYESPGRQQLEVDARTGKITMLSRRRHRIGSSWTPVFPDSESP